MKKIVDNYSTTVYIYSMTKLQRILKTHGVTGSTALHKATGMSRQQASEIWTGKRNIGKKVALRISKVTGCPPADLMF